MKIKMIATVNNIYSRLWIAVTGTDKYAYRERSAVHAALMALVK